MKRRKRRDDHLDARISQTALDQFQAGQGDVGSRLSPTTRESSLKSHLGLHRALGLRPWQAGSLRLRDLRP